MQATPAGWRVLLEAGVAGPAEPQSIDRRRGARRRARAEPLVSHASRSGTATARPKPPIWSTLEEVKRVSDHHRAPPREHDRLRARRRAQAGTTGRDGQPLHRRRGRRAWLSRSRHAHRGALPAEPLRRFGPDSPRREISARLALGRPPRVARPQRLSSQGAWATASSSARSRRASASARACAEAVVVVREGSLSGSAHRRLRPPAPFRRAPRASAARGAPRSLALLHAAPARGRARRFPLTRTARSIAGRSPLRRFVSRRLPSTGERAPASHRRDHRRARGCEPRRARRRLLRARRSLDVSAPPRRRGSERCSGSICRCESSSAAPRSRASRASSRRRSS